MSSLCFGNIVSQRDNVWKLYWSDLSHQINLTASAPTYFALFRCCRAHPIFEEIPLRNSLFICGIILVVLLQNELKEIQNGSVYEAFTLYCRASYKWFNLMKTARKKNHQHFNIKCWRKIYLEKDHSFLRIFLWWETSFVVFICDIFPATSSFLKTRTEPFYESSLLFLIIYFYKTEK